MTVLAHAVYGAVPPDLAGVPSDAVQCSPLVPGSKVLDALPPASVAALTMHAPASTLERRYVMARALTVLPSGAPLTVLAANDKGGTRLADELESFGCIVEASHKRHHRVVTTVRPAEPIGLEAAIAGGAPRLLPELGLWSQPGLFNWDRVDPGTQLLLDYLPPLKGRGADLGCGFGVLARAVMAHGLCQQLTLIDIDRRAVDLARRNVPGDGVTPLWADIRTSRALPAGLDFVVTNPPFHDRGEEDRALGAAFIQQAATMLRPGGVLWLTANRHLPYEATMAPLFETVEQVAQAKGFKIYAARKATMTSMAARAKARP
jgi:16S rRNA (guanine1207-N2)-methyltransferase